MRSAHSGGNRNEMTTIVPIDFLSGCEAQECFVYKSGRLESVPHPFLAKIAARNPAQIRHQQLEKPGFCLRVTGSPPLKKQSDLARLFGHELRNTAFWRWVGFERER